MSKMRILIVDDEASIRNVLSTSLAGSYELAEANNGQEGLTRAADFHPHFIILDLGLPDIGGLEVLRRLRAWTTIPVLVLTVNDDEATKVSLLDAGADDYLTKPFSVPELMARIRVGLRNHSAEEATPVFRSGELEIDLNKRSVSRAGVAIKLSATEYTLLSVLVRSRGRVVSQSQLLTEVWGPNATEHVHYLRIYVGQIRKKIELDAAAPQHLLTEPGVGYRVM